MWSFLQTIYRSIEFVQSLKRDIKVLLDVHVKPDNLFLRSEMRSYWNSFWINLTCFCLKTSQIFWFVWTLTLVGAPGATQHFHWSHLKFRSSPFKQLRLFLRKPRGTSEDLWHLYGETFSEFLNLNRFLSWELELNNLFMFLQFFLNLICEKKKTFVENRVKTLKRRIHFSFFLGRFFFSTRFDTKNYFTWE